MMNGSKDEDIEADMRLAWAPQSIEDQIKNTLSFINKYKQRLDASNEMNEVLLFLYEILNSDKNTYSKVHGVIKDLLNMLEHQHHLVDERISDILLLLSADASCQAEISEGTKSILTLWDGPNLVPIEISFEILFNLNRGQPDRMDWSSIRTALNMKIKELGESFLQDWHYSVTYLYFFLSRCCEISEIISIISTEACFNRLLDVYREETGPSYPQEDQNACFLLLTQIVEHKKINSLVLSPANTKFFYEPTLTQDTEKAKSLMDDFDPEGTLIQMSSQHGLYFLNDENSSEAIKLYRLRMLSQKNFRFPTSNASEQPECLPRMELLKAIWSESNPHSKSLFLKIMIDLVDTEFFTMLPELSLQDFDFNTQGVGGQSTALAYVVTRIISCSPRTQKKQTEILDVEQDAALLYIAEILTGQSNKATRDAAVKIAKDSEALDAIKMTVYQYKKCDFIMKSLLQALQVFVNKYSAQIIGDWEVRVSNIAAPCLLINYLQNTLTEIRSVYGNENNLSQQARGLHLQLLAFERLQNNSIPKEDPFFSKACSDLLKKLRVGFYELSQAFGVNPELCTDNRVEFEVLPKTSKK